MTPRLFIISPTALFKSTIGFVISALRTSGVDGFIDDFGWLHFAPFSSIGIFYSDSYGIVLDLHPRHHHRIEGILPKPLFARLVFSL